VQEVREYEPLEVTANTVDEDSNEEYAVEVWDERRRADNGAPEEAHSPIGDVVL
jgi:hypothetical protein